MRMNPDMPGAGLFGQFFIFFEDFTTFDAGQRLVRRTAVWTAHFRHCAVEAAHQRALLVNGAALRGAVRAALPGAETLGLRHLADFPG